jgi:hypothetical protein
MIDIKEYIETRRDYRLMADYDGRKQAYFHWEMSLSEALKIFESAGKPNFIQECVKGGKRTVWDRLAGWGVLEINLKNRQEKNSKRQH